MEKQSAIADLLAYVGIVIGVLDDVANGKRPGDDPGMVANILEEKLNAACAEYDGEGS